MIIVDIHTHRPCAAADAIVSVCPWEFAPRAGQIYSVGIHPWQLHRATEAHFSLLATLASRPDVAMIGECGIDKVRGTGLQAQIEATIRHATIAETARKPLVLHCVRASNELCQLRRSMRPRQPWIVHGFRGNARVALQLLQAGLMLSYGEHFNPQALAATPIGRLLVETDESAMPITEIIEKIAQARQCTAQEIARQVTGWIAMNTQQRGCLPL